MATERKPEKPVEEAKKKLTINTSSEVLVAPVKDGTLSDAASCVSSGDATSSVKGLSYYPMNYYGYYYPVSFAERDDQSYVVGSDGLEFQQPAFPTDNSSVLYYKPGFQSTFGTYSPFLPGDYISTDGQYLGQQGYYAGSMFPHPVLSPGCFSPSAAYGPDLVPEYTWDTSYIYGDGANGHGVGDSPIPALRGGLSQAYSPTRVPVPSKSGTSPGRAVSPGSAIHGQTPKTGNKVASVVSKGYIPVTKFPPYHNQVKSVVPYTNSGFSVKENGQSWVGSDKLKTRNKLGIDFLNEQNRGPRTSSHKSASESGSDVAGVFSADDCNGQNTISPDIDIKREDYNLEDFPTKYEHALFFVIKSYSEDDIHKSIKYNVWASTPNGNQRLDNAFQISQAKMGEKGSKCPVFLFFSVNASGQFCGVAEMIGRVNFNKNMDFWQQDKWNGFFPVKWHIIKDVPNSQFRHIILENNDNKPVTNSRDTQEVKFSQGMEVLGIFKAFSSKTSILDDFSFYDNRQKAMQSKRSKAHAPHLEGLSVKSSDAAAPVGKAGELDPLIAGLKAVELGPAKSAGEPQMGVEVKE